MFKARTIVYLFIHFFKSKNTLQLSGVLYVHYIGLNALLLPYLLTPFVRKRSKVFVVLFSSFEQVYLIVCVLRTSILEKQCSTLCTYAGCEEEVEVFVEQDLVGVVAETEALKELMRKLHHLVHTGVRAL